MTVLAKVEVEKSSFQKSIWQIYGIIGHQLVAKKPGDKAHYIFSPFSLSFFHLLFFSFLLLFPHIFFLFFTIIFISVFFFDSFYSFLFFFYSFTHFLSFFSFLSPLFFFLFPFFFFKFSFSTFLPSPFSLFLSLPLISYFSILSLASSS